MKKKTVTGRALKKKVRQLLFEDDFEKQIEEIKGVSARRVVNPLFSFLCSNDALLKARAVTAMGIVVSRLADHEMESARIVMRRLMWSLNDESGGIGWGAPEAMGEIMSRHNKLADEYHKILISYSRPGSNFIENESLQEGVLWGIARLAQARPDLVKVASI